MPITDRVSPSGPLNEPPAVNNDDCDFVIASVADLPAAVAGVITIDEPGVYCWVANVAIPADTRLQFGVDGVSQLHKGKFWAPGQQGNGPYGNTNLGVPFCNVPNGANIALSQMSLVQANAGTVLLQTGGQLQVADNSLIYGGAQGFATSGGSSVWRDSEISTASDQAAHLFDCLTCDWFNVVLRDCGNADPASDFTGGVQLVNPGRFRWEGGKILGARTKRGVELATNAVSNVVQVSGLDPVNITADDLLAALLTFRGGNPQLPNIVEVSRNVIYASGTGLGGGSIPCIHWQLETGGPLQWMSVNHNWVSSDTFEREFDAALVSNATNQIVWRDNVVSGPAARYSPETPLTP